MIVEFIKRNQSFLILIILALFVWGLLSLFSISKESIPSIDLPYYTVSVSYPWADVETVEEQVTNKLESKFKSISDLDEITSTTKNWISVLTLKFFKSKKESEAINDIKTNIDKEYSGFPENVEYPVVQKISPTDTPIYVFSVAGPYSPRIVYQKIKSLENSLKWVQGVSEVNVIWEPQKQLKINLDYDKISQLNLSPLLVVSEVKNFFSKRPAGKKEVNWSLYSFEVSNYPANISKILSKLKSLEILNKDGRTIVLGDVWEITNTYEQEKTKSFVVNFEKVWKNDKWIGKWALTLQIKRSPWADIEKIIEKSKEKISNFEEKNPRLNVYEVTSDEYEIEETFGTFVSNFFQTAIYIFVIVMVFIGLRIAVGISLAFPLVYLITFIIFKFQWVTFNTIVSFSLVLTLGIMVDNLVVISESIYDEHTKENNFWKNLEVTYKKYMLPLIAWTSTTVVMFLPIYFMLSGLVGEFIKLLPVTIIINLIMSLLVALLLLPIILKFIIGSGKISMKKWLWPKILYKTWRSFAIFQKGILKFRKLSFTIVIMFWLFFLSSIMIVANGFVNVDFFGNMDTNNIWLNIEYKPWISLEKNQKKYTSEVFQKVQKYLNTNFSEAVKYVVINIWTEKDSISSSSSKSYLNIKLVDDDQREIKSYDIKDKLQGFIQRNFQSNSQYSYIKNISLLTARAWPSSWKPISFDIVGNDIKKIWNYVEKIFLPKYKNLDMVKDVSTSIEYTKWKIKYFVDINQAKKFDINTNSISTLITSIKNSSYEPYGVGITELKEFWEDNINVNMFMNYSWNINNLKVENVYLNKLLEKKKILSQIESISHRDNKTAINISSDKKDWVPLSVVTEKVQKILKENPLPEGMEYKAAWDVQQQQESMEWLSKAMLVWLFLMFLTIVFLFNNISYSLIILTSVFLSIAGVFYSLLIFWKSLNFPAQVGIFGVIGVWVNNAILLIQAYLNAKNDWKSKVDSLVEGISERFPPVFITTLTTIAWLSVLITDEVWWSLALVFIWGLFVNLFVIMIYIPALLSTLKNK